jgi:hypothetical protein
MILVGKKQISKKTLAIKRKFQLKKMKTGIKNSC